MEDGAIKRRKETEEKISRRRKERLSGMEEERVGGKGVREAEGMEKFGKE